MQTLEGIIEVPFRIDTKKGRIKDHLSTNATGFTLTTILIDKNKNLDLFSVCSINEVKLAISNKTSNFSDDDYSLISSFNSVSKKELNSNFLLSNFSYIKSSLVYFSTRYSITFNTANFKTDVYDKLSNGSFHFAFKAGGIFNYE